MTTKLEKTLTEDQLDLMKSWLKNDKFQKAKLNKTKIRFLKQCIRDGFYSTYGKKQLTKIRNHYMDWLQTEEGISAKIN